MFEGTVCQAGKIKEKRELNQDKYTQLRAGIKDIYKECEVVQFNIVFAFFGGYNLTLEENLTTLTGDKRETLYLLKKAQKWILSQNTEIVNSLYKQI